VIEGAVSGIAAFLNDLGRHFYGWDTDQVDVGDVNGDTMIYLLRLGLKHRPVLTLGRKGSRRSQDDSGKRSVHDALLFPACTGSVHVDF
jgi:hypothetical protein